VNLIFLGPNGAGKGTQARLLQQRQGIPHISTGDMLRAAIAGGTELGKEAERYVSAGDLVPDAVMIGIIAERLQHPDLQSGFVLDGFPRTIAQAEALEAVLAGLKRRLDRLIYFEVSEATLVRRLSGRMVCRAAGHIYNEQSSPPRRPGVCDIDGSEVYHREDDRPDKIRRRLQVYREKTEPLLAFYRERGLLSVLNAEADVEDVYRSLMTMIAAQVRR
jgi:adenylate kinase